MGTHDDGAPTPDDILDAYIHDVEQFPRLSPDHELELARAMDRGKYLVDLRELLRSPDQLGREPDTVDLGFAIYTSFKQSWHHIVALHECLRANTYGAPQKGAVLRAVVPLTQVSESAMREACEMLGLSHGDLVESVRLRSIEWDLLPGHSFYISRRFRRGRDWPDDEIVRKEFGWLGSDLARHWESRIEKGEHAKETLTEANLRLVVSVVQEYSGKRLTLLELVKEGNLGLARAVDTFQYHKGVAFKTYATRLIRRAITRAIADFTVQTIDTLLGTSRALRESLGRNPTYDEIAAAIDIPAKQVREVIASSRELGCPSPKTALEDFVAVEAALRKMPKEQLERCLNVLSEVERRVLMLLCGLVDGRQWTEREVAEKLAFSRGHIRRIHRTALQKVRQRMLDEPPTWAT